MRPALRDMLRPTGHHALQYLDFSLGLGGKPTMAPLSRQDEVAFSIPRQESLSEARPCADHSRVSRGFRGPHLKSV